MNVTETERGFGIINHTQYPSGISARLVQESSVVGDYPDAIDNPGSSALWIGNDFHLNREEVRQLTLVLMYWLLNKTIRTKDTPPC